MASNACFTASSAAAPVPILHCYGLEDYTMAKRYSFQLCFSRDIKWDVEEFLKDTFPRKKQIILAPYHGGNSLEPYHGGNSLAPYHGRISLILDYLLRSLGRKWPTLTLPRTRNLLPQSSRTFRQGILQPKLSFPYFVFSFMLLYCILFFILFLLLLLLLLLL